MTGRHVRGTWLGVGVDDDVVGCYFSVKIVPLEVPIDDSAAAGLTELFEVGPVGFFCLPDKKNDILLYRSTSASSTAPLPCA
jgi:hypothetical protein